VADTESKENELNQFNTVVADLEARTSHQQALYDQTMAEEESLQQQLVSLEDKIAQIKDDLNTTSRLLDARQNEFNLTKSLVDNLEGFPESIRFLRKNAGWKKQHPLFSDVL